MQELQERLSEWQGAEGVLPEEVDRLHRQLQDDFARLQAREAGAPLDNPSYACAFAPQCLHRCYCVECYSKLLRSVLFEACLRPHRSTCVCSH